MKNAFSIRRRRSVLAVAGILSLFVCLVMGAIATRSTAFRQWVFGTRYGFPSIASIAQVTLEPDSYRLRIVRTITSRAALKQMDAGLERAKWFKWPYLTTDDVGDWYLCLNDRTDVVVRLEFIPLSKQSRVPGLADSLGILKSSGTVQIWHDVVKTPSGFYLVPAGPEKGAPYLTDWPEFEQIVCKTNKE